MRAGRKQHGVGGDFLALLEPDDVASVVRLERNRPVRRGWTRAELARLYDCTARELGPADPGGKAEVVLDPA